jgi:lactoylglutathione lyase
MPDPEPRELASSPCQAPADYWDGDTGGVTFRLLVLTSRQPEAVRAFYQALGIRLTEERHGQGPAHYAGQVGPVVLEVYPLPEGGVADRTTRVGFTVADLGRVLDAVRAGGWPVVTPPKETPWGRRAVVHDPDGRAVELYQQGGCP